MRSMIHLVFFVILAASPAEGSGTEAIESAKIDAVSWLTLADAGMYESSWDAAAGLFQAVITKKDWVRALGATRAPLGSLRSRKMASANFSTSLAGAPDGEYVVFLFKASFENKASAQETVTAMKDPGGSWRVAGYFIR